MTIRSETETLISWTADDEMATVYSLMPRIWAMCIRAGGIETDLDSGIRQGRKVARTFLVPIKTIRIRAPRVLTGKALQTARERGRILSAKKMGLESSLQTSENDEKGHSR